MYDTKPFTLVDWVSSQQKPVFSIVWSDVSELQFVQTITRQQPLPNSQSDD